MPLQKGPGTIRANVTELMRGVRSPARKRAIATIAKKNNMSPADAMFRQAVAISRKQAQKK